MFARISVLSLAVALAVAPVPALAVTWVNVGTNTYGSTYDVDWDSIRRDGSTVTFTLHVKYGSSGPQGEADGYYAQRRANCASKRYADMHTDYMKNGALLRSSGEEEERQAGSGSIAEGVLLKVCS
jgi:hypothetical protein